MIPDLDIYRAANVLVKHHGQDAPIEGKGKLKTYFLNALNPQPAKAGSD